MLDAIDATLDARASGQMLTVIVETGDAAGRLPALLAALTSAAVEGLVREVLIVGGEPPELLAVLREETGAELASDLPSALAEARSEWLLVLPAKMLLRPGWLEGLARHLRSGEQDALIVGARAGVLHRRSYGVVIRRSIAQAQSRPGIGRLRRALNARAARLG